MAFYFKIMSNTPDCFHAEVCFSQQFRYEVLFSSPEPKAQGELLPSSVVRRVSSTITSKDISETARPRTLIFGM